MKDTSAEDAWENDRLGYEEIGHAFTNLVQSIDTEKVISIEAGFGRGKTFFRKAWAKQLKSAGEVVVEVDVQQSDHSGDPVITLLGALVDALPKGEKGKGKKALESARKVGAIGARALTRAMLKSGADEVFEAITDSAIDQLEDFDALDGVIKDVGSEMSKVAGQLIASQMAAERVRKTELPEQLEVLRAALVEGAENERVVVIIDELDRCHPEYAISFLEATKLIFGQSGFVFCLMVNADYLESLARHRFGVAKEDEKYLDKFVDIRLKLDPEPEAFKTAVYELACDLPLKIPYGENEAFSVDRAAELASILAVECGLSMRKTKRILLKVEVALRCYADRPLDAPLLVFMAFKDESPSKVKQAHLPRSFLTPEEGEAQSGQKENDISRFEDERLADGRKNSVVREKAPELLDLPADRYFNPEGNNYKPWALAFIALAPHYIPSHRSVLDGVASVLVSEDLS
ncbi:putative P-loop ATPase [Thalassovita gelatinovora]|uniref:Putative P-loop ATPase n=1 Tax=Thalassovita gelatinovora TaxID=53501 RepID=A0A0P1F730_THAGE|nr:P-loop NTPase fold protein [Thalassovita gelatinovora]QIZ82266.1 NTPase [Thalassovita gelatinovora]CUH63809.1 putative P-loop ATPase [Thalassovita gelatinovora]SEQ97343.1 KAP family P-loop domain-containing protein [Thalassovita gelatinovora]